MAKVEVDILRKVLERREVDVRKRNEILQDLKDVLEQEALEKEMQPPQAKKEFVILLSDPRGRLTPEFFKANGLGDGFTGWVVQIPEGENAGLALSKLISAAYEHNASPKGRKFPVETVGEACESVSPKTFKEHNLWVKTRLPVVVLPAANRLPKAPGSPD